MIFYDIGFLMNKLKTLILLSLLFLGSSAYAASFKGYVVGVFWNLGEGFRCRECRQI
jgi:hypothetical protein